MAKDGAPGLISKVVRLVLPGGPSRGGMGGSGFAGGAADGDSEPDHDAGKGRQLLRELMERRRRNDLVRQREFDQLRRIRRMAAASNPPAVDTDNGVDSEAGPTGFQDTALDHNSEERAVTLRKINEIEEQMSRQWWKTRPADPVDLPGGGVSTPQPPRRPPETSASRHQPLSPDAMFDFGPQQPRPAPTFAPTISQSSEAAQSARAEARADQPKPQAAAAGQPVALVPDLELPDLHILSTDQPDLELPDAALSQLVATGPGPMPGPLPALPGYVHHPFVEEAAIAFANGEIVVARDGLRMLIDAAGSRPSDEDSVRELWFTLFDLYRALGHRDQFESSAIAYAERFGRSPPGWISLAAEATPLPAGIGDLHWRCPALVGSHTAVRLQADAAAAPGAWWLDWSGLEGFEYDAVAPLLETFGAWCRLPAQIYFEGADRLLAALEARTLTGAADAEADWWRLRMETLRLLGRVDAYEEAALDYCITYEVSPPSWVAPACDCHALQIGSHPPAVDAAPAAEPLPAAPTGMAALSGEIGSDVGDALARLETALALQAQAMGVQGRAELLVVDCSRLVRLDFVAAGSVLGWAASRHGEGLAVEFRGLHRLAGAFFNVTGISEYARVYVRPE